MLGNGGWNFQERGCRNVERLRERRLILYMASRVQKEDEHPIADDAGRVNGILTLAVHPLCGRNRQTQAHKVESDWLEKLIFL